ncbi:MAG: insulinase family protein [Bacillaceae bacterium]|nr:insulinase family protein [Bacillaceae bacterium]
MEEIYYDQLKETLYRDRLDNGLSVYILPKPGFSKTYATFTTKYGSIDNHFRLSGQEDIQVPDGIAHFLEHKMFEKQEGDVFTRFSNQGASANAFTSFTRTSYLFSSTNQVYENLETLIDFVQDPYFTDESVEKEKGIIGQEIRMYQDNPDWRAYFGLIESLFVDHPVQIDIAGTIESIARIDKETLYQCYHTFYHPSNMLLFVVGPVDPGEVYQLVKQNQNQKQFEPPRSIERFYPDEPDRVKRERLDIELQVGQSKCLMGFKEKPAKISGQELLTRELATGLLLDMLVGPSSDLYRKLYEQGLIDDSFGFDYTAEEEFAFSVIGGDTPDPDKLIALVKEGFLEATEKGLDEEAFERSRKKRIGRFLRSLNSVEFIANQFTRYRFGDSDLFDIVPTLENLTLDEMNRRLKEHVDVGRFSASVVKPGKTEA